MIALTLDGAITVLAKLRVLVSQQADIADGFALIGEDVLAAGAFSMQKASEVVVGLLEDRIADLRLGPVT